jgi:hypothetical protein
VLWVVRAYSRCTHGYHRGTTGALHGTREVVCGVVAGYSDAWWGVGGGIHAHTNTHTHTRTHTHTHTCKHTRTHPHANTRDACPHTHTHTHAHTPTCPRDACVRESVTRKGCVGETVNVGVSLNLFVCSSACVRVRQRPWGCVGFICVLASVLVRAFVSMVRVCARMRVRTRVSVRAFVSRVRVCGFPVASASIFAHVCVRVRGVCACVRKCVCVECRVRLSAVWALWLHGEDRRY